MKVVDDIKVYANGSFLRALYTVLLNPNFHATLLYRIAHVFAKTKVLIPISKVLMYINIIVYSVDIDYRADLAGGFKLVHGIGTIIGDNVKTEGPVSIYHGVTLGGNGSKSRTEEGRTFTQPWLGKNVSVYAGASILGPCIIQDNAKIGAHSIINKDVEENKTVYNKVQKVEV